MIFTKDIDKFIQKIQNIIIKNKKFQLFIKALDEIVSDRYDIQIDKQDFFANFNESTNENLTYALKNDYLYFNVIIHYPEIIITNGRNKHKITDLYVKLRVRYDIGNFDNFDGLVIYSPEGLRASKTLEEITSGYEHSHLPRREYSQYFEGFCLGRGPLVPVIDSSHEFTTIEEYKYLLLLLDNYLKWESISGTPYNYINNIYSTEVSSNIDYSYVDYLVKNIKFKDINFKISDSNITVIPDENMENILFSIIYQKSWRSLLCYKTHEGKYVSKGKDDLNNRYIYLDNKNLDFTFKGKTVTFKILNTENINKYEYNSPNPYLTKAVCRELSKLLTKKHITSSRVTKENTVKNTQECSTADTLPL